MSSIISYDSGSYFQEFSFLENTIVEKFDKFDKEVKVSVDGILFLKNTIIYETPFIRVPQFQERIEKEKERLNIILENISKGFFTVEDAEFFVKIKNSDAYRKEIGEIHIEYIKNLLGPIYSSLYSFAVIGILAREKKPISYKELCNKVQKIFSEKFDAHAKLDFYASFQALLHSPLIEEYGRFFKKYALTEEGEVAYILLRDSINEILTGETKID